MQALIEFSLEFPLVTAAILAAIGACFGSFLTLVTYRLPLALPIGTSRSRCPHCGTSLAVRDLFPILSWVAAKGRCRHCKTKVSARYPLTELACALCCVGVFYGWGLSAASLCMMGLLITIVSIVVTDLEHRIILDETQIAILFLGVLYGLAVERPLEDMLIGGITGLSIGLALKYGFLFFTGRDGLGFGDVKFLLVAGVWLAGAKIFVPFLFYAGLLGIATSLLWRLVSEEKEFPFGPALAFSLVVCVFWPASVEGFFTVYGLVP